MRLQFFCIFYKNILAITAAKNKTGLLEPNKHNYRASPFTQIIALCLLNANRES